MKIEGLGEKVELKGIHCAKCNHAEFYLTAKCDFCGTMELKTVNPKKEEHSVVDFDSNSIDRVVPEKIFCFNCNEEIPIKFIVNFHPPSDFEDSEPTTVEPSEGSTEDLLTKLANELCQKPGVCDVVDMTVNGEMFDDFCRDVYPRFVAQLAKKVNVQGFDIK